MNFSPRSPGDNDGCVVAALTCLPGAFIEPNNRDFAAMCVTSLSTMDCLAALEGTCGTDEETNALTVSVYKGGREKLCFISCIELRFFLMRSDLLSFDYLGI